MFLREARLAAMLDHPNVVRAYDFGEIDGELFLAMEYVEGQALSRVLRALQEGDAELGASLTAHVLAEVCDGLHAAHELHDEAGQPLNLVHRDVSPQNVMVGYDGHVRLLDFGVAKIEAESVTKTGEVKGKTAYMSPEQAMGDAIDRRSDLFGVGAVLFECVTLRRMWGDGTDMDVIRKLALEQPPDLESVVPGLPSDLCALYKKLVSREAKDRPATARDVAEALRAHVPQGREEASRALKALLDEHFADQAEEQRRQLTTMLEEVAPAQARELRESISPSHFPPPPSSKRAPAAGSSTASVADATGANKISDGSTERRSAGVAATSREGRPWLWIVLALAVGAIVLWRLSSQTQTAPQPVLSPTASAPAPAPPLPASASASASASAFPSPSASPSASPSPSSRPVIRVLAQPTSATSRPAPTVSTKPTPVQPPPVATSKPPPDVDDHPF
jgi:serine/threonine-protein kinase